MLAVRSCTLVTWSRGCTRASSTTRRRSAGPCSPSCAYAATCWARMDRSSASPRSAAPSPPERRAASRRRSGCASWPTAPPCPTEARRSRSGCRASRRRCRRRWRWGRRSRRSSCGARTSRCSSRASAQLGQERERLRALRDLAAARQHQAMLAAAAARLRRETEMPEVMRTVGEELRRLGFESALLLSEARGLVIAHLSQRGPAASKALELLGFKRMSELRVLSVDPARSPMLASLVSSPEPVIEVQPGALLRALLGRRAPRPIREKLIDALGAHDVLALPLRGAADAALGILIAWPQHDGEPDLGALSAFSLQASLALERARMREKVREQAQIIERAVEERTRALRDANERLREADRRKDNFLANVSHELRSPLVTILGYTDLLLGDKLGPISDRQRQCLQIARNSGRRLRAFIEELLDFSRFELTRDTMTLHPFSIKEVVAQAVAGFAPRFLERRL